MSLLFTYTSLLSEMARKMMVRIVSHASGIIFTSLHLKHQTCSYVSVRSLVCLSCFVRAGVSVFSLFEFKALSLDLSFLIHSRDNLLMC